MLSDDEVSRVLALLAERDALRAENAQLRAALLRFGEIKGYEGVMGRDEFWSLLPEETRDAECRRGRA